MIRTNTNTELEFLSIPVLNPGKSFEALLSRATSPENILIDVIPDDTLRDTCDLRSSDGVVIDRGITKPHTGGDYYLIQHGDLRQIRQIMTMADNIYSVNSDHSHDLLCRDAVQVIGKVIGSVKVRAIN